MDCPHWSYSQIAQFLRCPLQFYFRRVLGIPEDAVSHQLALGSAVHEALASYHRSLQEGRTATRAAVREELRRSWSDRKGRDRIDVPAGKNEEEVLQQGEALLDAYLAEAPPRDILAVEHAMLVPVVTSQGEILEKPLLAVADLITRDGDAVRVHDFKTSARTYSGFEAATSLQATCYLAAARTTFGRSVAFRYTVLVKTKRIKVQHVDTTRSEDDDGRLGDLIQAVDRAVGLGVFYPVESPLNCCGCSYRRPCLAWGTPRQSETLVQLGLPPGAGPCSSNSTTSPDTSASPPGTA